MKIFFMFEIAIRKMLGKNFKLNIHDSIIVLIVAHSFVLFFFSSSLPPSEKALYFGSVSVTILCDRLSDLPLKCDIIAC